MELEPGSGEMDLRSRNMLELLEAFRGCNVFMKTVQASNAYRKGHPCVLALPTWFVEDNKERLCKDVILVTNKAWNLNFSFTWRSSEQVPQVLFSGGWGAFAGSNNLAPGDHLLFKLSGMSQFHVYIFNADGTPKAALLPSKAPVKCSLAIPEPPQVKEMGESSDGHRQEHLAANRKELKSAGLFIEEETGELPDEQGNDADEYDRAYAPSKSQKSHPSFFKRLPPPKISRGSRVPFLEIPSGFTRTHGGRLRTLVTLQGICQESPVTTVGCSWGQDTSKTLRLFLKYGWKEFWDANNLEEGQELQFTLTSDSTFKFCCERESEIMTLNGGYYGNSDSFLQSPFYLEICGVQDALIPNSGQLNPRRIPVLTLSEFSVQFYLIMLSNI